MQLEKQSEWALDTETTSLKIESGEDVSWDDEADVVIVGLGGAGVVCAIEALSHHCDVIAIDRFEGGGATAYSGGVIYAGGTRIQREAGIEDDVDEMAKYVAMEVGDAASRQTLARYCHDSAENLDWLISHGVPYSSRLFAEKTVFPPDGAFLYYSGNEKASRFATVAKHAPRGHRTVGKGFQCGRVFYNALAESAAKLGLRTRKHCAVARLVQDSSGRVIGVECRDVRKEDRAAHQRLYDRVQPLRPFNAKTAEQSARVTRVIERQGEFRRVRARRGVVITTGGFAYNVDLLNQHSPLIGKNFRSLLRMGALSCDGSSIRLGQSVGAKFKGLDHVYVGRNLAPPTAYLRGVLVNQEGRRFVNEMAYAGTVGQAMMQQSEGRAWLILNRQDLWLSIRQAVTGDPLFVKFFGIPALLNTIMGGTRNARTIPDLARKYGIDADGLEAELKSYNSAIAVGHDDAFSKDAENRIPIESSRYYAIDFSVANKFAFTQFFTLGGMEVDEIDGSVLRADGAKIPGLFAAGRAAFGICSNNYISGLSIGDCVFSGRRAGRSVASLARVATIVQ